MLVAELRQQDTARLRILKDNERDMADLFGNRLYNVITGLLVRHTARDGKVPTNNVRSLRSAVGKEVTRIMLGEPTHDGDLKPFIVQPDGKVIPHSPYMTILWKHQVNAVKLAVDEQAKLLLKLLPQDVLTDLKKWHPAAKRRIAEQTNPTMPPRLNKPEYDPQHEWIGSDNKRLSDRIWDATNDTRRKLDMYLDDAISHGMGSRDMAKELLDFLNPGQNLPRTNKPYGTNASYNAMRLARTEITSAHTRAQHASAMNNAFVETYSVVLSPSHTVEDICDDIAEGGPYPKEDDSYLPPAATHPQCRCSCRWNVTEDRQSVIDQVKALLNAPDEEPTNDAPENSDSGGSDLVSLVGPLLGDVFSNWLLGEE